MRRYHELRKDYQNNLYDRVENLDAAYELASNYVVERRNDRESSSPMQEEAGASEDAGEAACEMEEDAEAEAELASRPVAEVKGAGDHPLKDHVLFVRVPRI